MEARLYGKERAGKTTFLNLLLGKHDYSGQISADVSFDYFPFDVKHKEYNTLDVVEEIYPDYVQWEIMRELSLLQVSDDVLYRPFDSLSNGEQTKVMLAALFLKENSFLLIDEPTNHLDMEARELVGDYLKRKSGFILVSHDRAFLDRCVDHILSINKTNIEIQRGNFSDWWENKERQDNYELAENERLRKDVKRLSEAAKRTSNWSHEVEKTKNGTRNSGSKVDKGYIGHKAAKMMQRSKSIEQRQQSAIEEKSKAPQKHRNLGKLKNRAAPLPQNAACRIGPSLDLLRREAGVSRYPLFDRSGGPDRADGTQRLRQIKHPEIVMRGGHPLYRRVTSRKPVENFLCLAGDVVVAREFNRLCQSART
ncbi:hypothetical protein HMSSN139_41210 [Paenibacillus sp. HMSSN-139]|nr:hypothetical protein HMSSN139_41210 [Paenibacillus sp. HMSSN-139]